MAAVAHVPVDVPPRSSTPGLCRSRMTPVPRINLEGRRSKHAPVHVPGRLHGQLMGDPGR